jgi:hypothetical protein
MSAAATRFIALRRSMHPNGSALAASGDDRHPGRTRRSRGRVLAMGSARLAEVCVAYESQRTARTSIVDVDVVSIWYA